VKIDRKRVELKSFREKAPGHPPTSAPVARSSFPVMPEIVTTLALLVGFLYSQSTMSFLPMNELPELFPHVASWITGLDKQANESGRTLNPLEYDLARRVGVDRPEDVRILSVPQIPKPDHPRVRDLAEKVGLLTPDTRGLTAVHGVIVRSDCVNDLRLLAHEFVHVEQYERLGMESFLLEYIQQLNEHGYQEAPFEQEAEAKAMKACLDAGL